MYAKYAPDAIFALQKAKT